MGKYAFLILCRNANTPKNTPAEAKNTETKKSHASGIRSVPFRLFLLSMPTKANEIKFTINKTKPGNIKLFSIMNGFIYKSECMPLMII